MNAVGIDMTHPRRRLLGAAGATLATAVVVNLVIDGVAHAVVTVPHRFSPLQPGNVALLTIVGVLLATAFYRVLMARVADPVRAFRRIVPVVLVVTFIPDLLVWAAGAFGGTATFKTVLPLMLMHCGAAAACGVLLPRFASE